jgi:hypothetical protein
MKHFSDISEPYEYEKENPSTGEIEIVKKLSDCVGSDRSLLKLVKMFLAQAKKGELMDSAGLIDENQQAAIGEDEDQVDDDDIKESVSSDVENAD